MSVYYNDIEHFPCEVLRARIADGWLPQGTVDERDIQLVNGSELLPYQQVHLFAGIGGFALGLQMAHFPMNIRVLTGGFPCQDLSLAGLQDGIVEGEKSKLWKEIVRIIAESQERPFEYVLIENVANLLSGGDWQEEEAQEEEVGATDSDAFCTTGEGEVDDHANGALFRTWMGVILADLAEVGYDAQWFSLRASDVGAPHRRERVFIVAYPNQFGAFAPGQCNPSEPAGLCQWQDCTQSLANTGSSGQLECDLARITANQGYTSRRSYASEIVESSTIRREWIDHTSGAPQGAQSLSQQSSAGFAQLRVGRGTHGLSDWLDGYWPAGPEEPQHAWEPSRVLLGKQRDRRARLKALGNSLLPQLVAALGRSIMD